MFIYADEIIGPAATPMLMKDERPSDTFLSNEDEVWD